MATCGYAGYFPFAPGTAGSAVTLPFAWGLQQLDQPLVSALVIVGSYFLGVKAASVVEKELSEKDPSMVVVDEWVGMLITLFYLELSIAGIVVGFFLFRVMDIIKPFPGRRAEKIPGGTGIMLDDVVAGIYAHLLLRGAVYLWPSILLV